MDHRLLLDQYYLKAKHHPPEGAYKIKAWSIPFLFLYESSCLPTPSCCRKADSTIRRKISYIKYLGNDSGLSRRRSRIAMFGQENYTIQISDFGRLKRNKLLRVPGNYETITIMRLL